MLVPFDWVRDEFPKQSLESPCLLAPPVLQIADDAECIILQVLAAEVILESQIGVALGIAHQPFVGVLLQDLPVGPANLVFHDVLPLSI